jgi:periplasmic protein TonB
VIRRPPLATLFASLVAHGGVLALLFFLVSGESHPSVLFIDLEAVAERGAPVTTKQPAAEAGGGAKSAAPGSARQTRRDSVRPSAAPSAAPQPAAPPAPGTPAPSSEPEPVRERATAPRPAEEPRQPEPALAVVPARETAPDVVARSETSTSPAETRTNSGGATGDRIVSGVEQGGGGRATPGTGTTVQGPGGAGGAGVAPSGPGGGAPGAEYGGYLATVRRRFLEALRYPPPARSRGLTGTVLLEVFIKPDGAIGSVSVASSSSHPLLDEAALEAMRSLAPQPFPKGLAPRPLRVRLPVVFDLQ